MSRTYRLKHDKREIDRHLYDWELRDGYLYRWRKVPVDPCSTAGRCIVAKARSGKYIMHWHGPAWFRRSFAQVPYRRRAKRLIHNYMHGKAEDVILETKPHLPYWY